MKPRNHLESAREKFRSKNHGVTIKPRKQPSPMTSNTPADIKKKRGRPSKNDLIIRESLKMKSNTATSERSDSPSLPPVLTPETNQPIPPPRKREGEITCHVCGKRFKRASWLTYHLQINHPNEIEPPVGVPISVLKAIPLTLSETRKKTHHNCPHCDWKFKNPDRLALHLSQHHGKPTTPTKQDSDPQKETTAATNLDSIQLFFDSISCNQSARIVREFESILKHTNQFVSHLNADVLNPDASVNFDQMLQSNRGLLTKQQDIYEAVIQLISVKKDSLKFAFEDWATKNSPEAIDIEDYSTFKMDTDVQLELNADGAIVAEKKPNDISINGGDMKPNTNGVPSKYVEKKHVECQTNIQACDLHLSDCLEGDGEYEFLDSKSGMFMTNKVEIIDDDDEVKVEAWEEVMISNSDDDDNEEMVELIEVDDDDYEEPFEVEVKPTMPINAPIQSIKTYKPKHQTISNPEVIPMANKQLASLSPLPSQIRNALIDVVAGPKGLFKCIECSFTGKTRAMLIPHYKQTHLHGRTEQCKQCERLFIDSRDLQQHVLRMHTIRPTPLPTHHFPCKHPRCSNVFSTAAEMHAHMRSHFKGAQIRPIMRK